MNNTPPLLNIRDDVNSKTIAEFNEYDSFIKSQLTTVTKNNMFFLKCKESMGNLKLSRKFKNSSFDSILSSNIKQYTSKIKMNSNIISNKSFTSVFKNEENVNKGLFLHKSLIFNYRLYDIFQKIFLENGVNIYLTKGEPLFNGSLDKYIDVSIIKDESNVKYLNETLKNYITIFTDILKLCKEGHRVCDLSFADNNRGVFHSISTIFWFSDEIFYCGLYDPMYFERVADQYLWPTETFYILFTFLSKTYGVPTKIINLSKEFCLTSPKGKHCVQYMIDAEYCSMYCLYFFYIYARNNFPIDSDGMRKVVEETFIDEPSNITRSSCVSTNKFLIVMMSFIFTVVTLISDNPAILNKIKLYYSEIKTPQEHYLEYNMNSTNYNENGRPPSKQYQQPPYELLHPSMLKYLDQQIASMKTNGGRRNRKTAKSKKSNNKPYYPYRTH